MVLRSKLQVCLSVCVLLYIHCCVCVCVCACVCACVCWERGSRQKELAETIVLTKYNLVIIVSLYVEGR